MEVHFTPETEKKLKDLAAQSGRGTDDLVEDAMVGYFDELLQVRGMLDRRYDEMESGNLEGIDGEEAYRRLMEKTQERRQPPGMSGHRLHPEAFSDID